MKTIKTINLGKKLDNVWILENVNISFESGKIYGILGENGSGKTVFLKLLSGIMAPSVGEIWICGTKLEPQKTANESIGVIIEVPGFLPYLSGYKNLKYLASLKNKIGEREIIQTMLSVGLNPTDKKRVGNYSLGMRQKLGLAQALMEDPDILLLDEPINSLDASTVDIVKRLLVDLRNKGKTIIIASHILENIDELFDDKYIIHDGCIIHSN